MPRFLRRDGPGTWHHLMNRGIARRTIFETVRDYRFFLSLLAREVACGRLEIHGYCLMSTHFHLLVRSVRGELSEAMRRIQNRYARYFNRTRRRDGPLFRGRFKSRPIHSHRYRRNVLAYIHDNAVSAGLVGKRSDYRWCSAHDWKHGRPARWLSRDWVERVVTAHGFEAGDDAALDAVFPSRIGDDHRAWIERQLRSRHAEDPEDESLKHAASPATVRWTIRKAKLADGTRPWRPVCPVGVVERLVARSRALTSTLARLFPGKLARATALLRAGLLRMLSGCTHREIALRTKRHRGTVSHDIRDHRERFEANPAYARLTARIARAALAAVGV